MSERGLTVNGTKTDKGDFKEAVEKAVQEKGGQVVVSIDSDGGVTMGKVHKMQAQLRELGLNKVIYTGEWAKPCPWCCPRKRPEETGEPARGTGPAT